MEVADIYLERNLFRRTQSLGFLCVLEMFQALETIKRCMRLNCLKLIPIAATIYLHRLEESLTALSKNAFSSASSEDVRFMD